MARCRYCRPIKTTERKIRRPGIRSLGVGPPTRDSLRLTLVKWIFSAVCRYINHHLSLEFLFFFLLLHTTQHNHQPTFSTSSYSILLTQLTRSHKILSFKVRWTFLSSNIHRPCFHQTNRPDKLTVAVPSPAPSC